MSVGLVLGSCTAAVNSLMKDLYSFDKDVEGMNVSYPENVRCLCEYL